MDDADIQFLADLHGITPDEVINLMEGRDLEPRVARSRQGRQRRSARLLARLLRTGMRVVHFGVEPGLSQLDPSFVGRGSLSRRERQDTRVPVTFFYTVGSEPEDLVMNKARARYEAEIPDNLIDLASAPSELLAPFRMGRSEGYQALKDAGYFGFYNSASALPNAVAVFYPVDVTETEYKRVAYLPRRKEAQPVDPQSIEDELLRPVEEDLDDAVPRDDQE